MAIQNDLFLPARTAPAERYRLPGDIVVVDEPDERDLPDFPDFRVHGTAQIGDVGLAIIRMAHRDDDRELPPRVLEVGESISGYMLMKVEDEHATVVGPAGTYRLPVSALPRAAPPRRSNSSNNDQRSNADQARQLEQLIQQLGGRANIQIDRNNGRTGGRGGRGGGGEVPVAYFEYGDLPALGGGVTFDPRPALFGAVRREAIGTSVRWNPSGTNPGGV